MSDPMVSVAMSVHNGAATVAAAIRSILWQSFSKWELILVNDASVDSTASVIGQFRDPRIRVIHARQRQGLAVRLNECVDLARGKYIARMDADDIAYPERFERQVEFLESHDDIDLLGHGAVLFKEHGEVVGMYPIAERHEDICRSPWWGFPLAHPTWMGKRSWFLMERYDERLQKGQDQELLLRMWRKSRFASLPVCLLGYRIEKISAAKSARGRLAYCRRLVAQVDDVWSLLWALKGIGVHGAALTRDVGLHATGIINGRARRSYASVDHAVREQWRVIWNNVALEKDYGALVSR